MSKVRRHDLPAQVSLAVRLAVFKVRGESRGLSVPKTPGLKWDARGR